MILTRVDSVNYDETTQMALVLLIDNENKKVVPIWIGLLEAQSIIFKMKNIYFPRPMTHDLLKNMIEKLKGKIEYIMVNDVRENTFYAEIHIIQRKEKIVIDSRPSDAIALALRTDVPIYVSKEVYKHSVDKNEFIEKQESDYYHRYLETVDDKNLGKLKH